MASQISPQEAQELLQIEEADAWFEYHEETQDKKGQRYLEIEPWAWLRLQKRLKAIEARRQRLAPAIS